MPHTHTHIHNEWLLSAAGEVLRWDRGGRAIALPPNFCLQQQYAVVKPANSYTGAFLEDWSG